MTPIPLIKRQSSSWVAEKKEIDSKRLILNFEAQGIQVLNGRYGPYVTDGSKNARAPKAVEPHTLSLEDCIELLKNAKPPNDKKKTTRKKTTAKKKTRKKVARKKNRHKEKRWKKDRRKKVARKSTAKS